MSAALIRRALCLVLLLAAVAVLPAPFGSAPVPALAQTTIGCGNLNISPNLPNCYSKNWPDPAGDDHNGASQGDITLTVPAGTYTGYGTANTGTYTDGLGAIFIMQAGQQAGNATHENDTGYTGGNSGDMVNMQVGSGVTATGYSLENTLSLFALYGGAGGKGHSDALHPSPGGGGGLGGSSGDITLTFGGTITDTEETDTAIGLGLFTQGGQGGAGADGGITIYSGPGGVGGSSGDINLTLSGIVLVPNTGVVAETIGGNGGNGGDDAGGITSSSGNSGGDGGQSGNIIFTLAAGSSVTGGSTGFAPGILLLSQGGNGGNGGDGHKSGSDSSNGGNGGDGAASGTINAYLYGNVAATAGGHAVQIQSFGGNGGNGGTSDESNGGGGDGGNAADAGAITVTGSGGLITAAATLTATEPDAYGDLASMGVLVQSIGGGGGNGGNSKGGGFSVGGSGNGGADGADVSVTLGDRITANGIEAAGIVAQSIGGGGGVGGYVKGISGFGAYVVGGTGGGGGDAGTVNVTYSGGILTNGIWSPGILAQSIGGGGGVGGQAMDTSVSTILGITVAVGGNGGAGGTASDVGSAATPITNNGLIITSGTDSAGVLAQSIGGGGGAGGASAATAYDLAAQTDPPTLTFNLTVSVGGSGGSGGASGNAYALNKGVILIDSDGGAGVMAQSIAGGGGAGGDSKAASTNLGQGIAISSSISLGGSGGTASFDTAQTAQAENNGLIITTGSSAAGVVAQAIGGGGGWGGIGNASSKNIGSKSSISSTIAVGGTGSPGGAGGSAVVLNDAGSGILTLGDGAYGMLGQSIGGGGGNGGGGGAQLGGGTLSFAVAIGGSGGGGGNGGDVTATNNGSIVTAGADAAGIFVQSIGGGGGAGGQASNKTISGSGSGGHGSLLTAISGDFGQTIPALIDQTGNISANWQEATQTLLGNLTPSSIVGYGITVLGMASQEGSDFSKLVGISNYVGGSADGSFAGGLSLDLSTGGTAGPGGSGVGLVNVTNNGAVYTVGDMSDGIYAQSIGGGGGKGGASSASVSQSTSWGAAYSIGGTGGAGGSGGTVTVTNNGNITTIGQLADGIIAQSIGGGGGAGGLSGSSAGILRGIPLVIGGSGGTDGDGGFVTVTHASGVIQTASQGATGITAQSIGGGGGIFKGIATDNNTGGGTVVSATAFALDFSFGGLNGTQGASGTGGQVKVTTDAGSQILTSGQNAHGIFAQSIGGGGGLITGGQVAGNDFFGVTPMGGDGGEVTVNAAGIIETGINDGSLAPGGAIGIWAQSVGGGGGVAGDVSSGSGTLVNFASPEEFVASGNGGPVSVTLTGGSETAPSGIMTQGPYAHGIFAQSVAGGGGNVVTEVATYTGTAGGDGTAGTVSVSLGMDGSYVVVDANGANSTGIWAQSSGKVESAVSIEIGSNSSVSGGGSGGPAALGSTIIVDGGTSNIFSNAGVISVGDASSLAIFSNTALSNFSFTNTGTIAGGLFFNGGPIPDTSDLSELAFSVADVADTGVIHNLAGGVLDSGAVYHLGGGTLDNEGILSVGVGAARTERTDLIGNYIQEDGGTLKVDTDHANKAGDLLHVTGTADVSGTVTVNALTLTPQAVTVLTADGGLTLEDKAVGKPTYVFSFTPSVQNDTDLLITPTADFHALDTGLNKEQKGVAAHLQRIWDMASPTAFGEGFAALADVEDPGVYASTLSSLIDRSLSAIGTARLNASRAFVNNIRSCPTFVDGGLLMEENDCVWGGGIGSRLDLDSTADTLGFSANTYTLQVGGQRAIGAGLFIAGSLGYEWSTLSGDGNSFSGSGEAGLASLGLKYQSGALLLNGFVDAAYGAYDDQRRVSIGGDTWTATSKPKSATVGFHGRAGYEFPLPGFYLRPMLDLDASYLSMPGYTETGAGDFNLKVEGQQGWAFSAYPALELGTRVPLTDHVVLRPYASAGAAFASGNEWSIDASFADAPPGAGGFTTETDNPSVVGRVSLGLDAVSAGSADLRLRFDADFASGYSTATGSAKVSWRF